MQGLLDAQVAPSNADQLEVLARTRKNAPPVDVVKIPGINHLLVPAVTGETEDTRRLADRTVSPGATSAIGAWLKEALKAK